MQHAQRNSHQAFIDLKPLILCITTYCPINLIIMAFIDLKPLILCITTYCPINLIIMAFIDLKPLILCITTYCPINLIIMAFIDLKPLILCITTYCPINLIIMAFIDLKPLILCITTYCPINLIIMAFIDLKPLILCITTYCPINLIIMAFMKFSINSYYPFFLNPAQTTDISQTQYCCSVPQHLSSSNIQHCSNKLRWFLSASNSNGLNGHKPKLTGIYCIISLANSKYALENDNLFFILRYIYFGL